MSRTHKSSVRLTIGLAVAFPCFAETVGCQGLGLRSRDDMALLSDEDDWAIPSRNASQVPRPKLVDSKAQAPVSANPTTESRYALRNRIANASKADPVAAYGTNDSIESNYSSAPSVISTAHSDLDVDGALQSLPPAYRDVLKKQLSLAQQSVIDSAAKNSMLAKSSPREQPDAASKEGTVTAGENHKDGPVAAIDNKPSGKISVRLTDSVDTQQAPTSIASAKEPANAPEPIPNPIVLAETKPVSLHSEVVQASAIAPLPAAANATSSVPPTSPMATNTSSAWRQNVAQAIELLEKHLRDTPAADESLRLSQEITLRMLYVSQRRLDDAARPIESLSESEQEYIRNQMLALHEASNPDAMPVRSRHWSLVMNSQREATNSLAAASNIEVKSLAFCTEVERYGVITKFPKYQFRADEEVLLYCEIENVAAEKVRNGFETQLQGSYEIIDANGRKVADQILPMEPEICQNHRRDYFIVYKVYMPQQIASGSYQMKLTIEDLKGRKFGQNQIEFQIRK